jgi:hypothetical protein
MIRRRALTFPSDRMIFGVRRAGAKRIPLAEYMLAVRAVAARKARAGAGLQPNRTSKKAGKLYHPCDSGC